MTYSRPPREIVQMALYDAIDWTTSFLDSMSNIDETVVVLDARQRLSDYREMLNRRYGYSKTPMERATDNMVRVNVRDLIG